MPNPQGVEVGHRYRSGSQVGEVIKLDVNSRGQDTAEFRWADGGTTVLAVSDLEAAGFVRERPMSYQSWDEWTRENLERLGIKVAVSFVIPEDCAGKCVTVTCDADGKTRISFGAVERPDLKVLIGYVAP